MSHCPACGNETVPVVINASPFLIIEELPELVLPDQKKTQFADEWTPRGMLHNELQKVGMSIHQFDIVSAFPHTVPENGKPDENCWKAGLDYAIGFIPKYKGVLILGRNLCKEFTGYELDKVMGLSDVESKYIPDGDIPRYFLQPVRYFYSVGSAEFAIGLQRFAERV